MVTKLVAINCFCKFTPVILIVTIMLVVSTRDFRTNQTKYLNMVQAGEDVILRSRAGSFKISPITEDDSITSKKAFEETLRHALQEVADAKAGKLKLKSAEDLLSEL